MISGQADNAMHLKKWTDNPVFPKQPESIHKNNPDFCRNIAAPRIADN
jgi:hypothetical protein